MTEQQAEAKIGTSFQWTTKTFQDPNLVIRIATKPKEAYLLEALNGSVIAVSHSIDFSPANAPLVKTVREQLIQKYGAFRTGQSGPASYDQGGYERWIFDPAGRSLAQFPAGANNCMISDDEGTQAGPGGPSLGLGFVAHGHPNCPIFLQVFMIPLEQNRTIMERMSVGLGESNKLRDEELRLGKIQQQQQQQQTKKAEEKKAPL